MILNCCHGQLEQRARVTLFAPTVSIIHHFGKPESIQDFLVTKQLHAVCSHLHTLVAGLLAGSQYPEGPATGHLGTGFSRFPCVYKQMLRWFPRLQLATACFSCSPPDLNSLDPYFVFMLSLFHIYVHA